MAELELAVYDRLRADAAVSALVGTRIHPNVLPAGSTLPAITYFRVSATRVGALGADSGLAQARMQVSCWASTNLGMTALAKAVRDALKRLAPGAYSGVTIEAIFQDDGPDIYEPDSQTYQRPLDFLVWFQE